MITEDQLEQLALDWFRGAGYRAVFGPDIAPDGAAPERADYKSVILGGRFSAIRCPSTPAPPRTLATRFAAFDQRLTDAAHILGMAARSAWPIRVDEVQI